MTLVPNHETQERQFAEAQRVGDAEHAVALPMPSATVSTIAKLTV